MLDHYSFSKKLGVLVGFSPRVLFRSISGIPYFITTLIKYRRLNSDPSFRISVRSLFPILSDRGDTAGVADGHYFHQDLWAAKKIHKRAPSTHFDIGSRVDGFVAHLLVFMPVTIVDIRSLASDIPGLTFVQDDATQLRQIDSNTIESLSSLHAAEHFGLGRYSDPVDPNACFVFMKALERILAPGGNLYFSVPVGQERVEFNAHRVFAPRTILDCFSNLRLVSFSFVGDDGRLYEIADPADCESLRYGCGLFHFEKPRAQ